MDVPAFFETLSDRQRRLAYDLALGEFSLRLSSRFR